MRDRYSSKEFIDISEDTNLAASSPITLTDDTIGFDLNVTDARYVNLDGESANITNGTFSLTTTGLGHFGSMEIVNPVGGIATLTMDGDGESPGTLTYDSESMEFDTDAPLTVGGLLTAPFGLSLNSSNITNAGNITGTDVDISAGTGTFSTTGTLTAGIGTFESDIFINRTSNTVPAAPTIFSSRSRTGGIVSDGDSLFRLTARGNDGDTFANGGQILNIVDGNPADGVMPGRWEFKTSDASGNLDLALTIDSLQDAYFEQDVNVAVDLNVSGVTTLGDGTNETRLSATGAQTLHGTARVTKYSWIDASALRALGPGGGNPAVAALSTNGWVIFEFTEGVDDYIQVNVKVPDDMDLSADSFICIGWSSADDDGDNCVWGYRYLITAAGEDADAAAEVDSTSIVADHASVDGLVISNIVTIAGATIGATDICIHLSIYRKGGDGDDTITGNVDLHGIALMYTASKLGE